VLPEDEVETRLEARPVPPAPGALGG